MRKPQRSPKCTSRLYAFRVRSLICVQFWVIHFISRLEKTITVHFCLFSRKFSVHELNSTNVFEVFLIFSLFIAHGQIRITTDECKRRCKTSLVFVRVHIQQALNSVDPQCQCNGRPPLVNLCFTIHEESRTQTAPLSVFHT